MNKLLKGKMPVSKKTENSDFTADDLDFNPLKLDAELKKELEGKGLVGRFLNARQLSENYGYHKSGWTVYKRDMAAKQGAGSFRFGADPEGHVRYRDLILGVKPIEEQARFRAKLAHRNKLQSGYGKQAAAELRALANQHETDITVHEGYENNGDTDGDEE